MLRLEKMQREHVDTLIELMPPSDHSALAGLYNVFDKEIIASVLTLNPSYIFLKDGKMVGGGGILISRPGHGIVWACFDEELRRHPLFLARSCKRQIEHDCHERGITKLKTYVAADFEAGKKFIEWLGFVADSKKKVFGFGDQVFIDYIKTVNGHGRRG